MQAAIMIPWSRSRIIPAIPPHPSSHRPSRKGLPSSPRTGSPCAHFALDLRDAIGVARRVQVAEGSPKFLEQNPDKICQTCVDKLFKDLLARKLRREYLLEVGDINRNIELNDCVWSTIFFNPEFAEMI